MSRYSYAGNSPSTLADPSGAYPVAMGGCIYNETDFYVDGQYDSSEFALESCGGAACAMYDGFGCGYQAPNYYPYGGGFGGGTTIRPPKVGPPPPTPVHTGKYTDYLACVGAEAIILGFGNSDRAFATHGFNIAPFALGFGTPTGAGAAFFAAAYDIKLLYEIRETCMEEVYAHP